MPEDMLVFARGVGAGRWCWGRFAKAPEDDSALTLSPSDIRFLPGVEERAVPGRAPHLFLVVNTIDGSRKFVVLLSFCSLRRLFKRFTLTRLMHQSQSVSQNEVFAAFLPASSSRETYIARFAHAVVSFIDAKTKHMRSCALDTMYSITPSFYELCATVCSVDCEMFADAINESGVLSAFCSADSSDVDFGSLGSWESNEERIVGGAGNPPFCPQFLQKLFDTYDAAVQLQGPYCRVLVVPSAQKYRVLEMCATGKGAVVITIPPNNLGMKHQPMFYTTKQDYFFPQPLNKQGLFVCLWVNTTYWKARPPPADVEDIFDAWIMYSCRSPKSVTVHREVISAMFPRCLRSNRELADQLVEPIMKQLYK